MTIIKTNSGKEFDQIDGESILGSAKKAGINFQYSCKTGRCSSCKCKLISGNTQTYSDEIGSTESEVKDGYIQNVLIEEKLNLDNYNVYACGLDQMISDANKLLTENGLKKNSFFQMHLWTLRI